jgi:hypothetical protein
VVAVPVNVGTFDASADDFPMKRRAAANLAIFAFVLAPCLALTGCNGKSKPAPAAESKAAADTVDAVRAYYTATLRKRFLEGRELRSFFPQELGDIREPVHQVPEGVREAYAFYRQNVMDRDWGSASAYRVDADETSTYAVFVRSDGGDCWLEVFDEEGLLLGAARYDSGVTLWRSRTTIRSQVFGGGLEPELLEARKHRDQGRP